MSGLGIVVSIRSIAASKIGYHDVIGVTTDAKAASLRSVPEAKHSKTCF
jgi:hypothetical protein